MDFDSTFSFGFLPTHFKISLKRANGGAIHNFDLLIQNLFNSAVQKNATALPEQAIVDIPKKKSTFLVLFVSERVLLFGI
jgi:hypothetical protein